MTQMSPGTLFAGEFRIERALSAGGMGSVYVVEQLKTGRKRALKLMHPQLAQDARFRERFEREARISATIESDHVVEVIDAGVDDETGMPWLAMELLHGEDLSALVARRGALPADEILHIFEELTHALSAAHEAGVVHRDLKPENIFLAQSKRAVAATTVKVLDFGIAKVVAEAHTRGTGVIGTPLWMAPEQTIPDGRISRLTDVWPLGLIGFFLATGKCYWKSAHSNEAVAMMLLREVAFEPLAPASQRCHDVQGAQLPDGFDEWFSRCVARLQDDRFQSVEEVCEGLAAVVKGEPLPARRPQAPPQATPRPQAAPKNAGPGAMARTTLDTPAAPHIAAKTVPGTSPESTLPQEPSPPEPGTFEPVADAVPPIEAPRWPLLAAMVAALVLVGGGAFVVAGNSTHDRPEPSPAGAVSMSPQQALLDEAEIQRARGHFEVAHSLTHRIADSSPLRATAAFRKIEDDWARHIIKRYGSEDSDDAHRKLNAVAKCATVSANLRKLAVARLEAREEVAELNTERPPPSPRGKSAPGKPGVAAPALLTDPVAPAAATPAKPNKFSMKTRKGALLRKMRAGTATERELRIIRAICTTEGDSACRNAANAGLKRLKKKKSRPPKFDPDGI